ncbi:MAG: aminodeoxychorismate/anthranilate synthase component II [Pseudomonadota bacterium]
MILVVDNYDSFVHNLSRYIREAGGETTIIRNDEMSVDDCLALGPRAVVLSPGPKKPTDAGICLDLLHGLPASMPVLGVCLGHQCLVEAFGGRTVKALEPLHGEASAIRHSGAGVFEGLSSPLPVGRYHSLASVVAEGGPLEETAWSDEGDLMAVAHRERPWFGVQFHPESLLTPDGRKVIQNFLRFETMRDSSCSTG